MTCNASSPFWFLSSPFLIGIGSVLVHLGCHSGSLMKQQHKAPENKPVLSVRREGQRPMSSEIPVRTWGILRQCCRNLVAEYRRRRDALYVWFTSRHLTRRETAHARNRDCCVNRVPSLRTLVGIVEDGPTFETSHLAGPPAASGQDIINQSLMRAACVEGGAAEVRTGFRNHLWFHRHLRIFTCRSVVSWHLL